MSWIDAFRLARGMVGGELGARVGSRIDGPV